MKKVEISKYFNDVIENTYTSITGQQRTVITIDGVSICGRRFVGGEPSYFINVFNAYAKEVIDSMEEEVE